MSLLYFDGFDTYGVVPESTAITGVSAGPALKAAGWTGNGIDSTTMLQISRPAAAAVPEARNWLSTNGLTGNLTSTGISGRMQYNTTSTNGKVIAGFKVAAGTPYTNTSNFWPFMARVAYGSHFAEVGAYLGSAPGSLNGVYLRTVSIWNDPAIVVDGVCSNVTPTGADIILASSWVPTAVNTIEIELDTINNTATLWINNVFVKTMPALPNELLQANPAHQQPASLVFGEGHSSPVSYHPRWFYTDVYVVDGAGDSMNSRLGKVRVHTRLPTGDVQAELSKPNGASTNASVAGQVPPSSSNFLTGVNVDDTDLYSSAPFDFSNEAIIATAVSVSAFKTDPAGNNLAPVIQVDGTTHELPAIDLPVGTTYGSKMSIITTNPATGLPFTKNTLDTTAFGVRVKAPNP